MFAIMAKDKDGIWDFYPDPLYETREQAEKKVAYLDDYCARSKYLKDSEHTIKELTQEEVKEHTRQWDKWRSAID